MVKRRPGRNGGKRGPGNDLGGSLVEYALVLSLVAVVAAGALVYLGSSVSHTVNKISVAVTTDPPSTTTTARLRDTTEHRSLTSRQRADGITLTGTLLRCECVRLARRYVLLPAADRAMAADNE